MGLLDCVEPGRHPEPFDHRGRLWITDPLNRRYRHPIGLRTNPGLPEARPITQHTNGDATTTVLRALGSISTPVVQATYHATS